MEFSLFYYMILPALSMTLISSSLKKPFKIQSILQVCCKILQVSSNSRSICLAAIQANTRSLKFPGPHRAYFCIVFLLQQFARKSQNNAFQYKSTYCVVQALYVTKDAMFNTRTKGSLQPNIHRIPNKAVIYNPENEFSQGAQKFVCSKQDDYIDQVLSLSNKTLKGIHQWDFILLYLGLVSQQLSREIISKQNLLIYLSWRPFKIIQVSFP